MLRSPTAHALVLVLFASGCGGAEVAPVTGTPPPEVELGVLPDSPAGRRLAWVVERLNDGGPTVAEIQASFTPELLAGFPAASLATALANLATELRPLNVDHVVGTPETNRVTVAVLSRGADWYSIKIVTADDDLHLISGIHYAADPTLAPPPPPDWTGFETEVVKIAPRVSFLAAELTEDCRPIASLGSATSSPVASAFKLYVLDELVEQVASGEHTWDELLAIDDADKSLPSGYLHLRTAGSTLTLEQFATSLIADSDNTAADHLIHLLGRERVEARFAAAGHADPAKNRPLMKTREFFLLKLWATSGARDAYAAGDEATKRHYLEDDLASVDVFQLERQWRAWTAPIALDSIEWFASNEDLCRVMLHLEQAMDRPEGEPLRRILSKNTVFPFAAPWTFAGFKGGEEPGLLDVTWLVQRADQRWFLISLTASDPTAKVAQGSVVQQAKHALALLARQ